jgi:O-antigen/teichoic acid export membrane protein
LRLLPWPGPRAVLGPVLAVWLPLYFLLSLRRVYGQSWRWIIPKALAAALLYLFALAIGLVGVAGLELYFA